MSGGGVVVWTVNVRVAGLASVFADESVARTLNVCEPFASVAVVCGELQAANEPPSIEQAKLEPASFEEKPKVGVVSDVVEPAAGPLSIVVFGAVVSGGALVSTVKLRVAGVVSLLDAASMAYTLKVWLPSPSGPITFGLEQGEKGPPSTEHWRSELSLAEKPNWGVVSVIVEPLAGPESIVVFGGVVSTVNERDAGLRSVLPDVSVART